MITSDTTRPTPAVVTVLVTFGTAMTVIASRFVLTSDDLTWGSTEGVDRLRSGFADYNGRYAGNLAVLLLTRERWLAALVVGLAACAVLHLVVVLSGRRTPLAYLVGAALIVAMPLSQWRQTITWTSGFSNYTLATVGLLVFAAAVRRDWTGTWPRARRSAWLALPSAFIVALFMEPVTLLLVIGSLANLALLARARRPVLVAGGWALGSAAGAALMFSNGAYRNAAAEDPDHYQQIGATNAGKGLDGILKQGMGGVSQFAVTGNTALNLVFLVLAVVLVGITVIGFRRTGETPALRALAATAGVIAAVVAVVLSLRVDHSVYPGRDDGSLTPEAWKPALALLVAIVLVAAAAVEDRTRRVTVLVLAAGVVVLVTPLAAITPFGPRNFLPSYALMTGIVLVLLVEVVERGLPPLAVRAAAGASAVVVVGMLTAYLVVYSSVHSADAERLRELRAAVAQGQGSVRVPALPHHDYVHAPDPTGELAERYKAFYRLPAGLQITVVPR
ncbi:MAG: hypothetical protein JWQ74_1158 [Marmoricola sp.]|nr:hypothetical protein [Marmoricola sp.]